MTTTSFDRGEEEWSKSEEEQAFHNAVRDWVVSLFLFLILLVTAYCCIVYFRRTDSVYREDDEETSSTRVSLTLCTVTLATAFSCILLLPISTISNEVLTLHPDSYYVTWIHRSLIYKLWQYTSFFARFSLLCIVPFTYLFTESVGFSGIRKGLLSRMYEAFAVLLLFSIVVCGSIWVGMALLSRVDLISLSFQAFVNVVMSGVSFLAVAVLIICCPTGISRLLYGASRLHRPQLLSALSQKLSSLRLERLHLIQTLNGAGREVLDELDKEINKLERKESASTFQRNVAYPLTVVCIVAATGLCIFCVVINILRLLLTSHFLENTPYEEDLQFGVKSLSFFGWWGATINVALLIFYLVTATVGFYSLPLMAPIIPVRAATSQHTLLVNCLAALVLASSFPVTVRLLGITNFRLLSGFSSLLWQENFYVIFLINTIFVVLNTTMITGHLTTQLRQEIAARITHWLQSPFR